MDVHQEAWSEAEARRVLAELEESGLTVAEFCRRRGIDRGRVYRWRRRLGDREAGGAHHPAAVELVASSVDGPEPSWVAPDEARLLVHYPSGHRVELDGLHSVESLRVALRAVVLALAEVSPC